MPGLQTPARELKDAELIELVRCASAVLIGATYHLYDLAIAEAIEHDIKGESHLYVHPSRFSGSVTEAIQQQQAELQRIEVHVTVSWVEWAASTRDNWDWMMARYNTLRQSYLHRYRTEPHWHPEMRRLWLHGPRPRAAGRTPFPDEPC